jgi:DNA-binding transcriptional LysR family regulator
LTLKELVTTSQLEGLDSGQLDIGLMRPHARHGELETVLMATEPLMLAIPEREAADWPERPLLSCVHGKPFLMYSPYEARYFYQLLNNCFDAAGVTPDVVEHIGQIHTMLALVSSGVGVALIPTAAARLQLRGVVLRTMQTEPPEPVQTICAYRRDNGNPILDVFRRDILPAFVRSQRSNS